MRAAVAFRPARLGDMKVLHEACFGDRPLAQFGDSFKRSLEAQRAGQRLHLLALAQRLPIATGQLIAYSNSVEIADLAVATAHRGKGLGTTLITVLSRVAVFADYDAVEIGVMKGNSRALALYHRLGFVNDREFSLTDSASVLVLRKPLPAELIDDVSQEAGDDG